MAKLTDTQREHIIKLGKDAFNDCSYSTSKDGAVVINIDNDFYKELLVYITPIGKQIAVRMDGIVMSTWLDKATITKYAEFISDLGNYVNNIEKICED